MYIVYTQTNLNIYIYLHVSSGRAKGHVGLLVLVVVVVVVVVVVSLLMRCVSFLHGTPNNQMESMLSHGAGKVMTSCCHSLLKIELLA